MDEITGVLQSGIEVGNSIQQVGFADDTGKRFVSKSKPTNDWSASGFQRYGTGLHKDAKELRSAVSVTSDDHRGAGVFGESRKNLKAVFPNGDRAVLGREGFEGRSMIVKECGQLDAVTGIAAAEASGKVGETEDFLSLIGEDLLIGKQARIGNEQKALRSMNKQISGHLSNLLVDWSVRRLYLRVEVRG